MSAELRSKDSVTICEPAIRITEIAASSLNASSRCLRTSKVTASGIPAPELEHQVAEVVGARRLAGIDHERGRGQLHEGGSGHRRPGGHRVAVVDRAGGRPAVEPGP